MPPVGNKDFTFVITTDAPRLSRENRRKAKGHNTKTTWRNYRAKKAYGSRPNGSSQRGDGQLPNSDREGGRVGESGPDDGQVRQCEQLDTGAEVIASLSTDFPEKLGPSHELGTGISLDGPCYQKTTAQEMFVHAVIRSLGNTQIQDGSPFGRVWALHRRSLLGLLRSEGFNGSEAEESLLGELLLLDAVNTMCGFPAVLIPEVLDQVPDELHQKAVTTMLQLGSDVKRFCVIQTAMVDGGMDPRDTPAEQRKESMKLSFQCHYLRYQENAFIRATAQTFKLFLFLTAHGLDNAVLIDPIVDGLHKDMASLPNRREHAVHATSCPMLLGFLASRPRSEPRAWFGTKLRGSVLNFDLDTAGDKMSYLVSAIPFDESWCRRFLANWAEEGFVSAQTINRARSSL